jgi:hypothetical protein
VRLYEGSNQIEFIYGQMNNSTNTSASIGMTDPVGGIDHFLSITPGNPPTVSSSTANNNITTVTNLTSGTTYRFTPPCFNLWTGDSDEGWANAGNWNCATIPGEGDNATIPAGTPNEPVLGSYVSLAIIGIEPGASLILNGGDLTVVGLRIYGELSVVNNETITVSGTTAAWDRDPSSGVYQYGNSLVIFTGTGTLTTRAAETFNDLKINSGKSFDPGSNALRINGIFTNQGTFWPGTDNSQGNIFDGPVVNEALWRQRNSVLTFNQSFTNNIDSTFNASSDTVVGTVLNHDMTNWGIFNASDNGKLVVKGNWINNGEFSPGYGKVIFGGENNQMIQASSGTNQFYDLEIASNSQCALQNSLNSRHNLLIDSGGSLDLDVHALSVAGVLTNKGTLIQNKDAPAGVETEFLHIQNDSRTVDVYWGVNIYPENNMGTTRVEIRGQQVSGCTSNPSDASISRCYSITPPTTSTDTIKFYYQGNEMNGLVHDKLNLWHYQSGWMQEGENYAYSAACSSEQKDCWLNAEQVESYSPFILGSGGEPTVIGEKGFQVTSFKGKWVFFGLLALIGLITFVISNTTWHRRKD